MNWTSPKHFGPVEGQGINATLQRVWHHCARKLNAVDSKSTFVVGTNKYNNDIVTANLVARMKKRL